MLSEIDFHHCNTGCNTRRSAACSRLLAAALVLVGVCVTGCSTPNLPAVVQGSAMTPHVEPLEKPQAAQVLLVTPPPDATAAVLAYADRIRTLQGAELQQEIARLGETPTPDDQLRLAVALSQTRQLYDLVRAQDLLQRVLANASSDARPLHPLARLLAARFTEQRRAEDQLDRQGQQLRDALRRLDQTNDKLEALKEIERSLTVRPGNTPAPAATAPRGRNRPATP